MKKICLFIFLIFIVGCAAKQKMTALEGMPSGATVMKVYLKGENCNWEPNSIKVKKDSHVILEVESVDWDYNFRLNGYDLRFEIPKGKKVTAEFYASKSGEFEYGCYIDKGLHYSWGGMIGKLIVE